MSEHDDDYLWNPDAPPDPEIVRLEHTLRRYRGLPVAVVTGQGGAKSATRWDTGSRHARWPLAAAAALLLLVGALHLYNRVFTPWSVIQLPHDRSLSLGQLQADRVAPGATIVTDSVSRARLNVGSIGRAELGPSSEVRVLRTGATEHRLALIAGSMHARIWAPPRFFVVETVGAEAIDLGCIYTLRVDPSGVGLLHVESGEVELVGGGHRARVPAGNLASVRAGSGPGLPYPAGAPALFVSLVQQYERDGGVDRVDALLAAASRSETITLWHLLLREAGTSGNAVYGRLQNLAGTPPGVTREAVLRLEPAAMAALREYLEPSWTNERPRWWKRWWRALWL